MIKIESSKMILFLKQVTVNLFSTFSISLPKFSRHFYSYVFFSNQINHFLTVQYNTLTICPLLCNRTLELFQLAKLKLYTCEE